MSTTFRAGRIAIRFLQACEAIKTVHQINSLDLPLNRKQKPQLSEDSIEFIVNTYRVCPVWLLTGRGAMFRFDNVVISTTNHYHTSNNYNVSGNAVINSTANKIWQEVRNG